MADHDVDLYGILGISSQATVEDIRRAYRECALRWHPDRVSNNDKDNAKSRFQEVVHAFAVLSDPLKRQAYDDEKSDRENVSRIYDPDDACDQIVVQVSLKEVRDGCTKKIEFERPERCNSCRGCGHSRFQTCPTCAGSGRISMMCIPGTSMVVQLPENSVCIMCGATGVQPISSSLPCRRCQGACLLTKKHTYSIHIPAGVHDGSLQILPGKGRLNVATGRYHALKLCICHVFESQVTSLDEQNGTLYATLAIALPEVLCGFRRELILSHLQEPVIIDIKGYRSPMDPLVMSGLGLHTEADLVVTFKVEYPPQGDADKLNKYACVFQRIFVETPTKKSSHVN